METGGMLKFIFCFMETTHELLNLIFNRLRGSM
jgi:hypothetical protein